MSMSASGSTIMWFFAPPSAWTALAGLGPGLVDVAAIGVEPTNETAVDVGMLEDSVDRDLVAVDDVEDAVRDAGLGQSSAR
jgi:hypothetical protein